MIYPSDIIKSLWDGNFGFAGNPQTEEEFNSSFMPVSGVDENGVNVFETDPSKFPVSWQQFSAKRAEIEAEEPLRLLREERNKRLSSTDWWATSDRTMTEEQISYRQALRDITATYTSLEDVVWPIKPEV
jgi:hypothetical protein